MELMNRRKGLLQFAVALVVLAPFSATAELDVGCNGASPSLDVRVQGVRSDLGTITFVLYGDNPDEFLVRGKKLMKKRFPAKNGSVEFCVVVPQPGTYAATAYHDENGNTKLDKNWVGMPIEGFGVSNNPDYWVVPSHAEAAINVQNGPTRIDIKLRY